MPPRRRRKATKSRKKRTVRRTVESVLRSHMEKKFIDFQTNLESVAYNNDPIVRPLSNPAQAIGDAAARIGDKLDLAGMHLSFFPTASNTMVNNVFRVIVFQWHPDNTVDQPGIEDILLVSGTPADRGPSTPLAPYNHDGGNKFSVICDRLFNCNHDEINDKKPQTCTLNLSKIKKYNFSQRVNFKNSSAQGTELLYILVVSNVSGAEADRSKISYWGRITYWDA